MYETLEHWNQYKQKKYQQCPAEKPGAMILDEMIEAEELQAKLVWEKEMDKFLNKLIAKNGTTNY